MRSVQILSLTLILAGYAPASYPGAHDSAPAMAEDHSMHDMAEHSSDRDELGRRLFGMKHKMSPEISEELRRKVPLFEKYTDAEIGMSMFMMGPNYEWYLSDADVQGSQAVLLLLHGFRDGDPLFKKEVEGFSSLFPTAMAPGMSMMMSDHIQLAVEDLEAAGAKQIVVVPIVSTYHNTMMRQWEYIFGVLDEAAYGSVPQVKTNAEILFAKPPGADPIIAEILIDHALEISSDPENEAIIVAAHGPSFAEDNEKVLAELSELAKIMSEDSDFKDVQALTLQDDAKPEIRDANIEKLRKMVADSIASGKNVLVVTNLIGTRSVQAKLRKDLQGLDYKFNKKGVAEHPNFVEEWMSQAIREQFEDNPL